MRNMPGESTGVIRPNVGPGDGDVPRTEPPPAGIVDGGVPQPTGPVQWADPRDSHGSESPQPGTERTNGRMATRREHMPTAPRDPPYRTDIDLAIRDNAS